MGSDLVVEHTALTVDHELSGALTEGPELAQDVVTVVHLVVVVDRYGERELAVLGDVLVGIVAHTAWSNRDHHGPPGYELGVALTQLREKRPAVRSEETP